MRHLCRSRGLLRLFVSLFTVLAWAQLVRADDGYWASGGGGSWANPGNWDSGTIADGSDNTAYFGFSFEPPLPSSVTFTLDGARTIGSLYFTAQSGPDNWTLNPGTGGVLTLDANLNAYGMPEITVDFASQQITLNTVLDGTNGFVKDGPGTLVLGAVNTYSGKTVVDGGALVVNGQLGQDGVTVAGGTLGGSGTILGPVIISPGATLFPANPSGAFTISNSLTLQAGSTTRVEVNASTLEHDSVQGLTMVSYAGTLTVSNLAGSPATGQSFALFNAPSYTGNFNSITPQLTGGLRWRFQPESGVLSVVSSASQPAITSLTSDGTHLVGQVNGGTPGAINYVLTSTNPGLPRSSWTSTVTNTFDVSGSCNFTNAPAPTVPQQFYLISEPLTP